MRPDAQKAGDRNEFDPRPSKRKKGIYAVVVAQ